MVGLNDRPSIDEANRVSKIRVLVVTPTLAEGGAERFSSILLSHLDRRYFTPFLCLFRDRRVYALPDDVPVIVVNKHKYWDIPGAITRLARHIRLIDPHVVLSTFSHTNLVTGHAIQLSNINVTWVARIASHPQVEEAWMLRPWMSSLYRRAQSVVANSKSLGEYFAQRYPKVASRVFHIPNPADFDAIDYQTTQACRADNRDRSVIRVLAVGRLSQEKRVNVMIEAMSRLVRRHRVELHICGKGELRGRLDKQIATLGLQSHVILRGFCENPYHEMANADVFLLTSLHEGFPNSLIEAQGLGLPAVVSDCPFGPQEIIQHERTGLLVPTGDVIATTEALGRLIEHPELRRMMSGNARRLVREKYNVDSVVPQYERLFKQLVKWR